MYIVGLTGGIGSGKSTVTAIFESFGVPLVDTDAIAHAISQPNMPGAQAVFDLFGPGFIDNNGAIERTKLRKLIFADVDAKHRLEGRLHPIIQREAHRQLRAIPAQAPYALLAVPLLFETNSYQEVINTSLVVDCPEPLQVSRVVARSHLSPQEVEAIMRQQLSRTDRCRRADNSILNDGDLASLEEKVRILHRKYTQAAELQQDSL
ncbi:dephospho-CoA kinase [Chitinimonas sp. BJB300]|uniref:dephospho-CoA kinase n=1 Tax=Chitinimonas sp. BJB300 TaxID=1559339 RepID=UPI000C0DD2B8|nr:dephospho-CoA kinase [Chitinimonas sp. BJB300]PHV10348.1 dephospho-CoA kinase [Chitinimonas sp. BJB300]TSJ90826.1 dephospho-CoA kinase [Chitinimonas sp. BJB300]